MHLQTDVLFNKFRFLIAGILAVAFLIAISALVTNIGSNSVIDPHANSRLTLFSSTIPESPNAVTTLGYQFADGMKHAMVTAGTTLYTGCKSITSTSATTGKFVGHSTAAVAIGIGKGFAWTGRSIAHVTMFTLHGIGAGFMYTVRLPGKIAGTVTNGDAVSAIIRPADTKNESLPTINTATSADLVQQINAYNEQDKQEFNARLAAQLAANQGLDGSVVAGDPTHGGYPAKWDAPVRQDSLVDSWGMYNRECVSYAAWKVYQTYGNMPYWGGIGNANQWLGNARRAGIPTSATPKVHSVAISMRGYYGHAMWVEKVQGDMVYVSQYNYDLHGHYSEMWVNSSYFTYIYFK